jgi:hypothetical protein
MEEGPALIAANNVVPQACSAAQSPLGMGRKRRSVTAE